MLDNFLGRMRKPGVLGADPGVRGGYRFPNLLHALYFRMKSSGAAINTAMPTPAFARDRGAGGCTTGATVRGRCHIRFMRRFNTEGPVRPDDHYGIPPLDRLDLEELLGLIRGKRYFVLHAPRQTGKTSALIALRNLLNRGAAGDFRCVSVNVEVAQVARDDTARGMRAILSSLATRARLLGDDYPDGVWPDVLTKVGPEDALKELLTRWCLANPTPLVLLVDEIDSLVGDTLLSVLRQLRAGYEQRPEGFPQSVVLCGVRDVRDYRIRSSTGEVIAGGSPFNVAAKSLRMGDFTEAETRALMAQHTEDGSAVLAGGAGFSVDADAGPAVAGERAVRRSVLRQQGGTGPLAPHRSGRRLHRAGGVDSLAAHAPGSVGAQAGGGSGTAGRRAPPERRRGAAPCSRCSSTSATWASSPAPCRRVPAALGLAASACSMPAVISTFTALHSASNGRITTARRSA